MRSMAPTTDDGRLTVAPTPDADRRTRMRRRIRPGIVLRYLVLILSGATMILPFVWMLTTSLKAPGAVMTIPPEIFPRQITLESYIRVAETVPLLRMLGNSMIVTISVSPASWLPARSPRMPSPACASLGAICCSPRCGPR